MILLLQRYIGWLHITLPPSEAVSLSCPEDTGIQCEQADIAGLPLVLNLLRQKSSDTAAVVLCDLVTHTANTSYLVNVALYRQKLSLLRMGLMIPLSMIWLGLFYP